MRSKEGFPPSIDTNVLSFLVKRKYSEAVRGLFFQRIREEKLRVNLVLLVVLILESQGLNHQLNGYEIIQQHAHKSRYCCVDRLATS